MRRLYRRAALAASFLLIATTSPHAAPASDWNLSGFGTVGLTHQSGGPGGGFRRDSSQPGSRSDLSVSQDSRLGLQANWTPDTAWEAGVQVILAQRPHDAPLAERVEWAFVGYRPLADTRIRVGRVSPDIFLYSDSRNVGYALPWVRPPVEFYGFAPVTSMEGVDVEQRWSSGNAAWRARLTAGAFSTSSSDRVGDRVPIQGRGTFAAGLTREDNGLLIKASILHSRLSVDTGAQTESLLGGLQQLAGLPVPGLAASTAALGRNLWSSGSTTYFALGAQYDKGDWTATAEGSLLRVPGSVLDARRGYVSLGYRHDAVTYYGLVSRVAPARAAVTAPDFRGQLAPILGVAGAAQAQQLLGYAQAAGVDERFDQSSIAAGMRWDVGAFTALKLQVDRFDVRRNADAGWAGRPAQGRRGTLLSLALDVVWGQ